MTVVVTEFQFLDTASKEQEGDTDCTEQHAAGAMIVEDCEDCEDCEEMGASFRRAPDDNMELMDAQRRPAEWAFPCADADGGLGSYQPSAAFMQAFSSDLSDLMEL